MASQDETSINSDFYDWAGLDHLTSPFLVRENKLVQSVNLTSTGIVGGKTTRPPYVGFLDDPDGFRVRNLIPFSVQNPDGTVTSYLIRISGNNAYKYTVGSGATSWGVPISSFVCTDTTQPFGWTVLGNLLHLSNGKDQYQTFNGTDFFQDPSAPKARALATYINRVFASNVYGQTSRVFFSAVDYAGDVKNEFMPLVNPYGIGVTSIQVGANPGGLNSFVNTDDPATTYWAAILGKGTANEEDVVVRNSSGPTGVVPNQVWTLTLNAPTTQAHNAGDIIANNAPWYSDYDTDQSTANFIDIDSDKNGGVIFMDTVGASLVLHKANGSLYLYNGQAIAPALQANSPTYSSPGNSTVSPFAPDQISGIEIFPTRDGVYAYTGGFPTIISNEVYDYIQNMDLSDVQIAPGIAFKNKWYYSIGTVTDKFGYTITNCILVYDYQLNIWDTYSFFDRPTCFGGFIDEHGNERLVFGNATGDTFIFEQGTGDNGHPMDVVLQSHYITWGAPEKTKEIDSYLISTNPGSNFQLQFATDYKNNFQTFTTTSGMGVSDRAPDTMANFKTIAFRLISNTTIPMLFYGMTLKVGVGTKRFSGRKL